MIDRWREDILVLGQLGRSDGMRVEKYDQLDGSMGLKRIEGSSEMKRSREYIISKMKEAGLKVRVDKVGNIFGRKDGRAGSKVMMVGSHIDSVFNGGMFDGTVGVVGALEAVRRLSDMDYPNHRPIEIVVFMGEEGTAFKTCMLGSDVLCNNIPLDKALKFKTNAGMTLKKVLKYYGHKSDFWLDLDEVEYFIEMHIEQGSNLWTNQVPIGIVLGIVGYSYLAVNIEGQENHAGSTPMQMRKDALVAAANLTVYTNQIACEMVEQYGYPTVATVDTFEVYPGTSATIPGRVKMTIDIRDETEKNIGLIIKKIKNYAEQVQAAHSVKITTEVIVAQPPNSLAHGVINSIEKVAEELNVNYMKMYSSTLHDALNIARRVKTGMIFVPSVSGISHSPFEWTNWEDIECGIKVLTNTIKKLSV